MARTRVIIKREKCLWPTHTPFTGPLFINIFTARRKQVKDGFDFFFIIKRSRVREQVRALRIFSLLLRDAIFMQLTLIFNLRCKDNPLFSNQLALYYLFEQKRKNICSL